MTGILQSVRLLLLLAALASSQLIQALDAEATQQQLEAVANAIAEISGWLESASADQSQQENKLRESELALSEANALVAQIASEIRSSQSRLADLQSQQTILTNQREEQEQILQQIIRAAYMSREESFLKTLLNQEDPSTAGRMLHYTNLFASYQAQQIENYKATLGELQQLDANLAQALDTLGRRQQDLVSEQARLLTLKEEQETALAALNDAIQSRNAELEQLEVNHAELESLLQEIARAMEGIRSFEDITPLPQRRGELPPPLSGELLSQFGATYGGGSLRRQGVVIGADEGSPVRAVHDGYVAFANWLRGSGLLVVIDHGEGFVSLYGGNQALAVEAGEWVESGSVIATSGRGTESLGPGLYFELRQQGTAQDPSNWLRLPD